MSTTRFWGEPDDEYKVWHAHGRPLQERGVNIFSVKFGEMEGQRVQILGELYQFSVYKPSDGGEREMSTTRLWGGTRRREFRDRPCSGETSPWNECVIILGWNLEEMDGRRVQSLGLTLPVLCI